MVLVIGTLLVVLLIVAIVLLHSRGCRHVWRRIHTESMWDSNVVVTVYQCVKCGKIKREYRPS